MNIKVTEAEKKEIREAKADVVYLRNLVIETKEPAVKEELRKELHATRLYCRLLEENILALPAEEELDAMMEAALPRKKLKRLVIAIAIAVLAAIIFFSTGCNTAKEGLHFSGAVRQDLGWMIQKGADNINTNQE